MLGTVAAYRRRACYHTELEIKEGKSILSYLASTSPAIYLVSRTLGAIYSTALWVEGMHACYMYIGQC